ncbi:predicted protein [Plenodomus lingam JN3]|uniref:Predicted protein n=1 Tax=Leptosphaeria maculans (strain JN3 / isolate v23.1.3 / race Av1-4-5-6-7-8) TaxID=985895 RepID=E5AAV2_LEPMJ|nr:predicted protein [Plenodomus lingam JN3]CBY00793.1 predicted protein [Plenodomus lingam JN3]
MGLTLSHFCAGLRTTKDRVFGTEYRDWPCTSVF